MLYSIILLPFSKSLYNSKLCIDCKFYKKDKSRKFDYMCGKEGKFYEKKINQKLY